MGTLYVVGTPIGNLSDMTFRAVEVLENVDFIAAEDTRVSGKLLHHFNIKKSKPMVSYHEHNISQKGDEIVERIILGEDCAIVTDAGMPCISDPGEDLVKKAYAKGVKVEVIPGPSAVVSALAISGISTKRFTFQGFLSTGKKQRYEHLASVANHAETLIFYEAPHRLAITLADMLEFLGDRKISICKELTKIHESVNIMTISEAKDYYEGLDASPRGEFVLVIEGFVEEKSEKSENTLQNAVEQVMILAEKGMKPVEACKQIAKATDFSKSEIYTAYLQKNSSK